jgi:4-hydroxybenzoate polyprenyltransferase
VQETRGIAPALRRPLASALFAALRPLQWVKNGVLLVPAVFAMKATDPDAMLRAAMAVAAFCALCSASYLANDVADRERDLQHPEKRLRPIASGELSVPLAGAVAVALGAGGLGVSWSLGAPFFLVAAGYLVIQAAYSTLLKNIAVVDVFAIAAGFVLRVVAGAAAVDVPISNWLYLTTLFLALFLALEKRRAELSLLGDAALRHRGILSEYSIGLVDQLAAIAAAGTVMTYSLYTLAPDTLHKFGTDRLKFTIPFVLLGICRYLHIVHRRGAGGQPERALVTDRGMLLTLLGYGLTVAWAIYTRA